MMPQASYKIVIANSKKEFLEAKSLTNDYLKWLNLDLAFQNIEYELKEFENIYHPSKGGLFLLAYKNNNLAGGVGLKALSNNSAEIKRLFVYKEFRGEQIGYILLKRLIQEAREMGYQNLKLDTLTYMKSAIRLYSKLGFSLTSPYYNNPLKNTLYFELKL